jgi:hypothetical protein
MINKDQERPSFSDRDCDSKNIQPNKLNNTHKKINNENDICERNLTFSLGCAAIFFFALPNG